MDWSECNVVESVPGRMGGVPVVRRSRVTADSVFENYLLGESVDEIVDQYQGLERDDVEQVINYAVMKYIENREREDTLRSELALGTARAA